MFRYLESGSRLFAASFLLCLSFAVGTMAQKPDNKILDDEGVSALLEELKAGLPEFISDEEKVTAITEKWEAREDLAGKTKYGIIRLLIEDVRSIETDQELSLKIWHKWNGVKEDPKIEPKPERVRKPAVWIQLVHSGAYFANFDLTWDEPGKPDQAWKEHGKTAGWQYTVNLPGEATNIRLRMQNDTGLVWQPQREIFNRVLQPSDLNKCYRVTGTTLGSSYDNQCK